MIVRKYVEHVPIRTNLLHSHLMHLNGEHLVIQHVHIWYYVCMYIFNGGLWCVSHFIPTLFYKNERESEDVDYVRSLFIPLED